MTSKGLFYYSETGKTEAIIDKEKLDGCDIHKLNSMKVEEVDFSKYEHIVIGTPTYGRGVPPLYFKKLLPKLYQLKGKKIGLFGSGNTIYGKDYCGALDLLDDILNDNNTIVFKYRFEGYPREQDTIKLTELIKGDY